MKKCVTLLPVLLLWAALTLFAWFGPAKELSEAERRPLEQMPSVTADALLSGKYMKDFEEASLDQFPVRDGFRKIKALVHFGILRQSDNNGIYLADGFAAVQEYPMKEESVAHALSRFQNIYDRYLNGTGSRVYMAVVPDKGYYLGAQSGHLTMDYGAMMDAVREGMPWADHIDLTLSLSGDDYYRTDTHWRQENLLEAAQALCGGMGAPLPQREDYTLTVLQRPFYGVYYGQAALPMEADTMYLLENELLKNCTVYDYETGKTGAVYDMTKLDSRDLYDVFLSGSKSLLRIDNPGAQTDRELIVFRDSFGSAMVPLLVQGYRSVTLVDIRYLQSSMLGGFLEFHGQDVLFLYSTLVLNNSASIK